MQLPLEALPTLSEGANLSRDQRVELGSAESGEIAVADEASASQSQQAHERAVVLDFDARRQAVRHTRAQLRVVGDQQLGARRHRADDASEALALRAKEPSSRRHIVSSG